MNPEDVVMLGAAVLFGVPMIASDVREHRLPNRLTGGVAAAILLIAAVAALWGSSWDRWPPMLATGAAMLVGAYLLAAFAPSGLGLGDVKLLGALGLSLGHLEPSSAVLFLLVLAVSSAAWLALAPRFDRAADPAVAWRKRHIAFGPPIIVAWWLVYAVLLVAEATRGR